VRRLRVLTGLVGAIGVLLCTASLASAAAPRSAPAPASGIAWGPCSDPNLQAFNAQCGLLSVPLDYSHPNGAKIQLAVSRILHTSSEYQGIILTNPGGPGGSGLGLNPFLIAQFQADGYGNASGEYDWIGFDPRGVGSSIPSISCDNSYFNGPRPNYIPFTGQLLNTWLTRSKGYAQDCASQSAAQTALLHNMTTEDSALDMDSIRQALGQSQMSYYGYSYGTYLGQVYATLFPSHLKRLILDSNVDPRDVWYQANLNQDVAFNRNEGIWWAWLAKYNSIYHLGATEGAVERTFYTAEAQLAIHPAGGVIGPDEWTDTFLLPGYYQPTWEQWAQGFSDWVHNHDAAAANELIGLYDEAQGPGDDNEFAVYLGVQCTDVQWPTQWSTWSRDNWRTFAIAPFETWDNAWFNAPCIYWPAPASHPVNINGRDVKSALLVDETLDAATPFEGSLEVRKLFPNAVLLAEPGGTTHAETPDGDLCVDGTIANYLATGALPPRDNRAEWDKTCAPPPTPVPTSSDVSADALRSHAKRAHSSARSLRPSPAGSFRLGLPAAELH
jgi:pimeloyl-ACP methyl ester carboxylesterase